MSFAAGRRVSRRRGDAATTRRRAAAWLVAALAATALGGCLGEPEIEDRWTRLDLVSSNVTPERTFTPGASESLAVRVSITYRAIRTGFAVAELRASSSITAADVTLHPSAARLAMALDVDRLLANSVSVGRATRAVTGWDHLVQGIDFGFRARVPAASDTATAGLFLVTYLGSGEEIELANGADSLVITPFDSATWEILPVGLELVVAP